MNIDINKTCLELLYDTHSETNSKEYKELKHNIIDDMLMGKTRNGKLSGITDHVDKLIRSFYRIANDLYDKYHFQNGCQFKVYRGTHKFYGMDNNIAIQPIPFSTSIDKHNMDNWTGNTCCKWHIRFPLNTRFVAIDNPKEGREIVLPAGILNITKKYEDSDGILNIQCYLVPVNTYEEMIELQKLF